jgi:hypothetical protein
MPELHDVLKLTTRQHDISKWSEQEYKDFKEFLPVKTETWKGITQHHLAFGLYPTEPDTFYLCVADSLASTLTRIGEAGSIEYRLNRLWRGPEEEKDIRLKEREDIIRLFRFLQTDPDWQGFCREYEALLRNRPEDLRRGMNITSLYTHCKLTGQFHRILKSSQAFALSPAEIEGKTHDEVKTLYRSKYTEKWQLIVSRCKFRFLQKPYRVRDLNIFGALQNLINQISISYPDNVLLQTSDELLLILPEESQLSNISSMAHQAGFWVEVVSSRRALSELKPNPKSMSGAKSENLYNLPPEISPPICEICQSAKATKHWPEDYVLSRIVLCSSCQQLVSQNPLGSVVESLCEADRAQLEDILKEPAPEELCEKCFALRAEGTKLKNLDMWNREGARKVAWVKLTLDFDRLQRTMESLSGGEISFSVIAEFQEDYSNFLKEFISRIHREFGNGYVENVLSEFFCIRLGSFGEAFKVLEVYYEAMSRFFPVFLKENDSPLTIAIVCAGIKFPFFEVWRILEEAKGDIFISLQGMRTVRAPTTALELLTKAASLGYKKSALHKLTRIEETSKKLAELTFQNRDDKDHATYSRLARNLYPNLDFSSIFTFALLVED